MPTRVGWMVCLLIGSVACTGAPKTEQPTRAAAPRPTATSEQLMALPDCPPPPPAADQQVKGLTVPDGTVVTKVEQQDPLTNVSAYTPMTPAQFERTYLEMAGVTVLINENEIYEAELLISNGTHRTFFKATATCRQGSSLLAVVAPEVDAKGLPVPQRAAATPTP